MLASVSAIVLYPPLYLDNCLIDQADGNGAMAALVGCGNLKLHLGGMKVLESGLHARLVGPDMACQKAAEEDRG